MTSKRSESWLQGYNDCLDFAGNYCDYTTSQTRLDYVAGWNKACDDYPNPDRRKLQPNGFPTLK